MLEGGRKEWVKFWLASFSNRKTPLWSNYYHTIKHGWSRGGFKISCAKLHLDLNSKENPIIGENMSSWKKYSLKHTLSVQKEKYYSNRQFVGESVNSVLYLEICVNDSSRKTQLFYCKIKYNKTIY